jgi:DNA-binding NarL/FixJ family response regulator
MPVRVLVADDQKVIRDGLSLLLGMLPGVEVIGTAVDGIDAVRQAAARAPDVVLMDLSMPNCDGVEATRLIASRQPDVRVVVLTAFADDDSVFAALRAGARGYLTKNAGAGEILQALSAVCAGEAQLDPSVQRRLVEAVISGEAPGGKSRCSPRSERACPTPRSRTSSASPARRSRATSTTCSPRPAHATAASWSATPSATAWRPDAMIMGSFARIATETAH